MTTPLIIEDLNSNMFAVQTLVQEKEVLNNEKEIEFLLIENDETDKFIEDIQTGYKAHFRNNVYWIYNPVYEVVDDKVFVQCKAIHEFFPYFNGFYTQETWKDQSMTPADSILPLFDGKRFTVNIQSSLYAAVMNNERNVTYTERIMYALGRHDAEYQIDGTNFNIKHRLGNYRDDIILHPDINITDIKKEVESEGLSTWGKGFWQKKKDDEGSETEEYEKSTTAVHPLLSSIYGTEAKEGKAIYNDSVKHEDTMKELIIAALDETFTLKYTMSIKEYDNPELFRSIQLGDTLNAVIEKLDADIDLRVLEINRDWLNEEMQDMTITIGNGGLKAEYSSTSVDVLLEDVMRGKRPLPPSAYDEGVRRATALINGELNGNFQYMPDGVYGQDPDNPNHRTRYSIAGIAYMTDGRQWNQALTYRGLTASAIYTGTLRADLIEIWGADGNYRAIGGVSTWTNPNDDKQFVRISPQNGLTVSKASLSILSGNGENAVTAWDSAESNAKLHADTVAENAESNAKDYADGVDDGLRNDLQMTSPLPNELELSTNGITAYNNSNDRYARLDYRGLYIDGGAIEIRGRDKRELMIDGLMRGGRVANILPFHSGGYLGRDSSAKIIFNGMNWEWQGADGYQRVHYIDDQYHGRFMDFRVAVGLAYDSPAASARIKVSVTKFDGTVVGSGNFFVERDSENMLWENVRVDLQAMYGGVPDYRTVGLYAGVEITVNTTAKGLFRINRGEFNG